MLQTHSAIVGATDVQKPRLSLCKKSDNAAQQALNRGDTLEALAWSRREVQQPAQATGWERFPRGYECVGKSALQMHAPSTINHR